MASINKPTLTKPVAAPVAAKAPALKLAPKAISPQEIKPKMTKEETTAKLVAAQERRLSEMGTHEVLGIKVANEAADRWIAVDTLRQFWIDSEVYFGEGDHTVEGSRAFMVTAAMKLCAERGNTTHDEDADGGAAFWHKKLTANAKWQARIGHPLPGFKVIYTKTPEQMEEMQGRLAKGRATASANRASGVTLTKAQKKAASKSVDADDEAVEE